MNPGHWLTAITFKQYLCLNKQTKEVPSKQIEADWWTQKEVKTLILGLKNFIFKCILQISCPVSGRFSYIRDTQFLYIWLPAAFARILRGTLPVEMQTTIIFDSIFFSSLFEFDATLVGIDQYNLLTWTISIDMQQVLDESDHAFNRDNTCPSYLLRRTVSLRGRITLSRLQMPYFFRWPLIPKGHMDSNVTGWAKRKNISHQIPGWCMTKITRGVSLVCDKGME